MKTIYTALLVLAAMYCQAQAINIDSIINAQMLQKEIPAVSAMIVKKGEPLWFKAYGKADVSQDINATTNTAFMLASISKTITATALMHVYDNGGFQLNDPINNYLPFDVYNPNFPQAEITVKDLLTHTSGIADNWDILLNYYVDGDSPVGLGDFMEDYLTSTGANYDADNNFNTHAPGTFYEYSNIGAALCGHLVEAITGIDFNTYCKDSIFTPLCMDNTAWFINELNTANVALPHYYENGSYVGVPHYGYPDYPDGQLRTNVTSLGRFLNMYMNYGEHNGVRILDSTTVALMLSSVIPAVDAGQGLMWYSGPLAGRTVWGHSGGDLGVSTEMIYSKEDSIGVIVLTNGDGINNGVILSRLFQYALTLSNGTGGYPCGVLLSDNEIPQQNIEFKAYPNPCTSTLTIETGESFSALPIEIYDITGKKVSEVKETTGNKTTLNTAAFSPGFYTVVWNGRHIKFIKE